MPHVSADSLTVDEALPVRSRTFSPETVTQVYRLLTEQNVRNVGVGTFSEQGPARSTLTTLNRLLLAQHGVGPFAATVRETSDGQFKAILLNKPARKVTRTRGKGKAAPVKTAA